mmetsp:Transcript_26995/g.71920  ORF Transcript_26995/g.71920 Transcript_26995/m.71920 type:complete len:215 (+) Transcript_26995:947-1591(+)
MQHMNYCGCSPRSSLEAVKLLVVLRQGDVLQKLSPYACPRQHNLPCQTKGVVCSRRVEGRTTSITSTHIHTLALTQATPRHSTPRNDMPRRATPRKATPHLAMCNCDKPSPQQAMVASTMANGTSPTDKSRIFKSEPVAREASAEETERWTWCQCAALFSRMSSSSPSSRTNGAGKTEASDDVSVCCCPSCPASKQQSKPSTRTRNWRRKASPT